MHFPSPFVKKIHTSACRYRRAGILKFDDSPGAAQAVWAAATPIANAAVIDAPSRRPDIRPITLAPDKHKVFSQHPATRASRVPRPQTD